MRVSLSRRSGGRLRDIRGIYLMDHTCRVYYREDNQSEYVSYTHPFGTCRWNLARGRFVMIETCLIFSARRSVFLGDFINAFMKGYLDCQCMALWERKNAYTA